MTNNLRNADEPGRARDRPPGQPAAIPASLQIEGVSHCYGARRALIPDQLHRRAGEFHDAAWPLRRRQSKMISLVTRLRHQAGRIGISAGHGSRLAKPAAAGRGVPAAYVDLDLSFTQNLLYHAALHDITGARRARAPLKCSRASALPTAPAVRCATSRRPDATAGNRACVAASPSLCCCLTRRRSARRQGARRHPQPCPAAGRSSKASACVGHPFVRRDRAQR